MGNLRRLLPSAADLKTWVSIIRAWQAPAVRR
jgi:hypothetical protein